MAHALNELGRRERQIMEILFRHGRATAAEVLAELPDPPSYSAVRGMLRILEDKGYCTHEWNGPRHVYSPTGDHSKAAKAATKSLLQTFFNNSMESGVAAMLGAAERPLTSEEVKRLSKLIEQARKKGTR